MCLLDELLDLATTELLLDELLLCLSQFKSLKAAATVEARDDSGRSLLTIGPRFGGAINDAARYFKDAYDRNLTPYEFVESMKKKGIRVPGIGHRLREISTEIRE
nr:atp-citrate synthase beta chain protein 1 [Quercus suber]